MDDQGIGTKRLTTMPSVSVEVFRRLMAGFPTGVAVVTTVDPQGNPAGMTCSSLCSVSMEPPMLLVCLRRGSPTLSSVLGSSVFTVNLLHAEGQSTAELFASGIPDRFAAITWRAGSGLGGPRLLDDAHAVADCWVSRVIPAGDHAVVIGEVFDISMIPGNRPLLYGFRRYVQWPGGDDEDTGS